MAPMPTAPSLANSSTVDNNAASIAPPSMAKSEQKLAYHTQGAQASHLSCTDVRIPPIAAAGVLLDRWSGRNECEHAQMTFATGWLQISGCSLASGNGCAETPALVPRLKSKAFNRRLERRQRPTSNLSQRLELIYKLAISTRKPSSTHPGPTRHTACAGDELPRLPIWWGSCRRRPSPPRLGLS
jgi:hypothetical protein